ncbi:hypothetical protein [Xanthomonas sp. 3058]|uniref:hypothetical protein n=1 Tax=Xanthomonas sp. 3058 TaxID=3035314 RepID=UPI0016214538|nr:hypothetical protein [Xanthomonas sp. 3058]MBB5864580.1 hypothetical protein [Xanthomonas sp. 3058]
MIIWGSGGDVIPLGAANTANCSQCGQERSFRNVLHYRYAHLWYLFGWVTKKRYLRVCDGCNHTTQLDTKTFEATLGTSPIPAYRRFGGLVLLCLIAALVAFGAYSSAQTSRQDDALLAQPRQGDLYTVDLEAVVPGAFEGHAYGVVKVEQVSGQNVTLAVPAKGYSKWKGAESDARGVTARQPGYYTTDRVEVPLSKLQQLHTGNDLRHVYRN